MLKFIHYAVVWRNTRSKVSLLGRAQHYNYHFSMQASDLVLRSW